MEGLLECYLSCNFTTKQCEYKQINYITGPLQVYFAISDMHADM